MVIDCDSCTMKDIACEDCVVTFLTIPVGPPAARPGAPHALAPPPGGRPDPGVRGQHPGRDPRGGHADVGLPGGGAGVGLRGQHPDLGEDERTAIAVLAGSGLVPPLRMVREEEAPGTAPGTGAAGQPARCSRSAAASA